MFCPKCRTEYRKGFATCADCDVSLVNEQPPELPAENKPPNIYRKLDYKIIAFIRGHYLDPSEKRDIKLHSIITVMAILFSTSSFSPFFWRDNFQYLKNFIDIYRIVFALFCLILYVLAVYFWRVYFKLRKEGVILDKNFFFSESAGLYRKAVFYIALIFNFIDKTHYRFAPATEYRETIKIWRYASLSDLYREIGIAIFHNVIFLILAVECLRLIYNWSNKKHIAIVLLITAFISTLQIMVRYSISGHGMFW